MYRTELFIMSQCLQQISRNVSSCVTETLYPLNIDFPFPPPHSPCQPACTSVFWLLFPVLWGPLHPFIPRGLSLSLGPLRPCLSSFHQTYSSHTRWMTSSYYHFEQQKRDFEITPGFYITGLGEYGLFVNWITMHHLVKTALYKYTCWRRETCMVLLS